MEKRIILGTLGGAVAGLVVSMFFFTVVLSGMAEKWMAENASCLKEMSMTWWIVGSLVFALLLTIILDKFGISTMKSGAIAGTWLTFLIALWFGIFNASTYTAYSWEWFPIDVIVNTISGTIGGGAIGWILGKYK